MQQTFFILFFLLLFSTVLFGGHFLLYLIVVKFFGITVFKVKILLLLLALILSFSFVVSSSLAHIYENIFTKFLYFSSGIWLGFLLYFEIIVGIILLFNFVFKKYSLNYKLSIYLALVLSIIFVGYGICYAFSPTVKNIEIKIKNLPVNWDGKKVVMISDVHLGHIYNADFMTKIVSQINGLNPEAVFIVGDLFDGMDGNLDELVNPLNNLKSKKGVYYVTGNHETYLGVEKIASLLEKAGIKILNDEAVNIDGISLIGLSYPERGEFKDFKTVFDELNLDKTSPKILLYHSPVHLDQASNAGIDLQLSGHTHRGQMFPFNFITQIVYAGHDYGLTNYQNLQIYTSNGVGTWGPTLRTFNRGEIVNIVLRKM
ncbi:metallophosphoesterase [Candidatus Gracilibacteria bacterium]|nr:metallophosphoesterase [Candidatus Gracilibacteria bacterium]